MNAYPQNADGAVLTRIAARGVDMTRPRKIEFAVAVPDENAAEAVSLALRRNDYGAEIYYDEGERDETGCIPDTGEFAPSWTVYTEINMVPDYERIIEIQAELDRIATPLGGKSDGWGTLSESNEEAQQVGAQNP